MLAAVGGCTLQNVKSDFLVFRGTVTTIENSPVPAALQNWIITMHVDQIEKGNFKGTNFAFRVHSPSKSGLTSNGTYRVTAKVTRDGFVVDEFQWNK
jgi:hypothetical protein